MLYNNSCITLHYVKLHYIMVRYIIVITFTWHDMTQLADETDPDGRTGVTDVTDVTDGRMNGLRTVPYRTVVPSHARA